LKILIYLWKKNIRYPSDKNNIGIKNLGKEDLVIIIFVFIIFKYLFLIKKNKLGIGDWGLGIGDWGLGPIPNPQSPIPNPQSPLFFIIIHIILFK